MTTLTNVCTHGGEADPPGARLIPDTIPEAKSTDKGVSVNFVPDSSKHWFVFRASYGREDRAADFLINEGIYVYIPKRMALKTIQGKKKKVMEPLIPNLLFVYTTKKQAEDYIKNTPPLSFLSYYYNHFQTDHLGKNPPLVVPQDEMENFILATRNHSEHLLFIDESQCRFKGGEKVLITHGIFEGVIGRVARVAGQQRVVVSISSLGLVSTAYIPKPFLKIIE